MYCLCNFTYLKNEVSKINTMWNRIISSGNKIAFISSHWLWTLFHDGGGVRYGSGTEMCLGTKSHNAVKGNIRRNELQWSLSAFYLDNLRTFSMLLKNKEAGLYFVCTYSLWITLSLILQMHIPLLLSMCRLHPVVVCYSWSLMGYPWESCSLE